MNNLMKKNILILLVVLTTVIAANAGLNVCQNDVAICPHNIDCNLENEDNQQKIDRQKHHEQIQAMKVGYITEKVGLTAAESEKFWPMYNQYWSERREAAKTLKKFYNRVEKEEVSSADLTILLTLQESENAIMRRWADKFKAVLSPEKIVKMFVAEESFKWYLMKQKK